MAIFSLSDQSKGRGEGMVGLLTGQILAPWFKNDAAAFSLVFHKHVIWKTSRRSFLYRFDSLVQYPIGLHANIGKCLSYSAAKLFTISNDLKWFQMTKPYNLILGWQTLNLWSLKFPACLWSRQSWIELVCTALRTARPKKAGLHQSVLVGWGSGSWMQRTWLSASQHRNEKLQRMRSKTLSEARNRRNSDSNLQMNQSEGLWVTNILSK